VEKQHHPIHTYWPDKTSIKLPSDFFISIAKECGLLEPTECMGDYFKQMERLEMFQLTSVTCDFEISLAASFFGRKLTEEQREHLARIHDLTPKWLEGALISVEIDHLSSFDPKDLVADKVQEHLGDEVEGIVENVLYLELEGRVQDIINHQIPRKYRKF